MEGGRSPPPTAEPKPKFLVYQNPSFSAALTAASLRPSGAALLLLTSSSVASALLLLTVSSREKLLLDSLTRIHVSPNTALLLAKVLQAVLGLMLVSTMSALMRAMFLCTVGMRARVKKPKEQQQQQEQQGLLSQRQLRLLGFKPKPAEQAGTQPPKKPLKKIPSSSDALVPIRKWASSYTTPTRLARSPDRQSMSSGQKMVTTPMLSPTPSRTPSQYGISPATPWSRKSSGSGKGIQTEAMLEQLLADVDDRITDLEAKSGVVTPSHTLGFGVASSGSVASMTTASGTARSTPLRPVRMSPGSYQKYSTPPKKGEREFPSPMSMEQAIEAFEGLGIYPQIEQWRDRMRQWFSSFLVNPLLQKIETSDMQVMQTAENVGVSIYVSQVGSSSTIATPPVDVSLIDGSTEWQPTVTVDEDELLHQLRASLIQARDRSISQVPLFNQQQPQQTPQLPIIQACLDAIAEHQRLKTLMKGELIKGLLPQSSVCADYTVQRVEELAEGTCLKNYDYMGHGNGYDKGDKKWSELPTDSHLLLYLFCAFLEHPKWMLHVDPTSYSGSQSSKNPLFLGILPSKERFPEKYLAVISGVPSIIHPGACILSVGKQSPPVFALYWDKKQQFSLQGMTAFWDAVLLFCHQIVIGYGGVVHGLHLGSSAFNILPVLGMDTES